MLSNFRIHLNRYIWEIEQQFIKGDYFCPVCDKRIKKFIPFPISSIATLKRHGYIHSITCDETFNIEAMTCPFCLAPDKDRLYAIYLDIAFNNIDQSKKHYFIDFAPTKGLSKKIQSYTFLDYKTADLYDPNVDMKIDVQKMDKIQDCSIDFFLCSHVLEHVDNDKKAVKEFYRILKNNGWGILMAPINLALKHTYEDNSIKTIEGRWKHFGDTTHVRVYAKQDFIKLLKLPGFKVKEYDKNYFGKQIFLKHGIDETSVLYVVYK